MPSGSLRVVLIGAGGIAPDHATALRAIPGVELVAVCDRVRVRAQETAARFGIPRAYEDPAEMLAAERPQVAHVLTPPDGHVTAALECLRAGCDVFVEKPLGISVAECVELQETAVRLARRVGVNHTLNYTPAFRRLVEAIRGRKLGRLNHVMVTFCVMPQHVPSRDPNHFAFRSVASVAFEYAPHPFSVVRRLMGDLKRIVSMKSGEVRVAGNRSYHHSWQCSMECERGTAQLFLSLGRGVKDITVHAFGQDATAVADLPRGTLQLHESTPKGLTVEAYDALTNARSALAETVGGVLDHYAVKAGLRPDTRRNAFWRSIAAFYEARAAGLPFEEGAEAGTAVVRYCEEIVQASGA